MYVIYLGMIDNKMLPTELEEVLLRVQNSANFMPEKQMRVRQFISLCHSSLWCRNDVREEN